MTQSETRALTSSPPKRLALPSPPAKGWWIYWDGPACPGNSPEPERQSFCQAATEGCRNVPGATGMASYVYGKPVDASGKGLSAWQYIGVTCWPESVPRKSGDKAKGPSLMELVRREFSRIQFTAPTVNVQPPDRTTYVTKPIYAYTTFGEAGYGPGEGRAVTLLGHQVVITPVLMSVTYDWGDGTRTGPTSDLGGKHPNGKITHAYPRHGSHTVTITATYTASFSVDGSPARPLSSTTTRTASAAVRVIELENVLVAG